MKAGSSNGSGRGSPGNYPYICRDCQEEKGACRALKHSREAWERCCLNSEEAEE